MAADRKQLIKAIHTAKGRKGLSDDVYRDMLREGFGAESSTALNDNQLRALLTRLNDGKPYRKASSKAFVRKIFAVWGEMCRQGIPDNPTRAGLFAFVERMAKVSDPEFLTKQAAVTVTEALKAWQERVLFERRTDGKGKAG